MQNPDLGFVLSGNRLRLYGGKQYAMSIDSNGMGY